MPDPRLNNLKAMIRARAESGRYPLAPDVIDELACHLSEVYADACRQGQTPSEAHQQVVAALEAASFSELSAQRRAQSADVSRLPERSSTRAGRIWDDVLFDTRYAIRTMRRSVGFTTIVIAILAVGIGATTAAFTIVDAVLLRPLPYPHPYQLVVVSTVTEKGNRLHLSAADWQDYARENAAVMTLAAYASWPMNITGGGEAERVRSIIVSGNFFDVLATQSLLGRTSQVADDDAAAPAVVVLSHGFWSRRFGRDAKVVGRRVTVNGRPATVVGVMPQAFGFPNAEVDLWMPMGLQPPVLADRLSEWLSVIGRTKDGVPAGTAQAHLATTAHSLAQRFPRTNAGERPVLTPLLDQVVSGVRPGLWLGGTAVVLVLLAACANAANLLLARATMRRDEMALRAALGAESGRLARQMLVESGVLAFAGGCLGVGLASVFLRAFIALGSDRVPRIEHAQLNVLAVGVSIVASALTALLFGGGAAWTLGRTTAANATGLTSLTGRAAFGRVAASPRIAGMLLAAQVAFALVLVSGAFLVARSYLTLFRIAPGFDVADTLTMTLTLPKSRYANGAAHVRFVDRLVEEVSTRAGVTSVGVVSDLPFVGNQMTFMVRADTMSSTGSTGSTGPRQLQVGVRVADPGYFTTLRIPLVDGRYFGRDDRAGAPSVAIVNRNAAELLWGGRAIDRAVSISDEPSRTVVGIVGDIRHAGLQNDEGPVIYVPYAQKSFDFVNWLGVVVRGPGVQTNASVVKAAVSAVDPNQPVADVMLMADYVDRARAPYRFSSLVVGCLAAAAFVLALAGIYGLTAFLVGTRLRELGVRLALGASAASVVGLVLRQIGMLIGAGLSAGLVGALLAASLLRSVIVGVESLDTWTVAGAVLFLAAAGVSAGVAPALRAGRIDPAMALRSE